MRAYVFDVDQNLYNTETPIIIEKKHEDHSWKQIGIPHSEYQKIKNNDNFRDVDNKIKYSLFRDDGPNGNETFKVDIYQAISNQSYGPSYDKFVEAVKHANPIAIITARGHAEKNLRSTFSPIIAKILSEENDIFIKNMENLYNSELGLENALSKYIDLIKFYAVCNTDFEEKYPNQSPAFRKTKAMEDFLEYAISELKTLYKKEKISIGFSDDSEDNIINMIDFFQHKKTDEKFKNTHLVIYHTAPDGTKKIKITEKN